MSKFIVILDVFRILVGKDIVFSQKCFESKIEKYFIWLITRYLFY